MISSKICNQIVCCVGARLSYPDICCYFILFICPVSSVNMFLFCHYLSIFGCGKHMDASAVKCIYSAFARAACVRLSTVGMCMILQSCLQDASNHLVNKRKYSFMFRIEEVQSDGTASCPFIQRMFSCVRRQR